LRQEIFRKLAASRCRYQLHVYEFDLQRSSGDEQLGLYMSLEFAVWDRGKASRNRSTDRSVREFFPEIAGDLWLTRAEPPSSKPATASYEIAQHTPPRRAVVSEMGILRQLNPLVPMKGIYFVGVLLNRKP
jgi:hypothetical protein